MRILQYVFITITLLLSFSYSVATQKNLSDTKLMGLRGQVKSLVNTGKSISGYADWVLKDKTKYQTTYSFDKNGDLTEEINLGGSNSKYVYSNIDGNKTFKTIELDTPKTTGQRFTVAGDREEKPIEPDERLTEPDKRFDFKYVYETDKSGKTVIERQYQNNGKLFRKRTLMYNDAGVLTNKTEEDSGAIETYSYVYDNKGNAIEVNKTRHIKGPGTDSRDQTIYSEYKFDSVGNWTTRKITTYSDSDAEPKDNIPAQKYTFVDVQWRTLTYY
jgi:hypothetical protein